MAGRRTTPNACLEAIRRALEEPDWELQVSIHFNGTGQAAPEIRVMPVGTAHPAS